MRCNVTNVIERAKGLRANTVPKPLPDEQNANPMSIASELEERVKIESDYFDNVIIGHETWTFERDPKTKFRSSSSSSERPQKRTKANMSESKLRNNNHCVSIFA